MMSQMKLSFRIALCWPARLSWLVFAGLLLAACAQAAPDGATAAPDVSFKALIPASHTFIDQLVKGDFAAADSTFDATMKRVMPEGKLKDTWNQLLEQTGAFQAQLATTTTIQQGYHIVLVTCRFHRSVMDVRVAFDGRARIAGLFFQPTAVPPYVAPAYAKPDAYHETPITVGSGTWALPGTLTLPNGNGPFPAVVMVHGSGPNDRDETNGANKPFRDLAWGLATQGIAVLRYDKRTLVHGKQIDADIAHLTVKEETTDDALLAAQLLRKTPRIDPKRVFILGHSQGATLAPRIGQQDSALAGLIVMAGLTRTLEDTILDQIIYLNSLSGPLTDKQEACIAQLRAAVARAKDPQLSAAVPASDLPLGLPASYFLDLRDYHPEKVAKGLSMPLLVLQGERDYQVSPTQDFPAWQTALAGRTNATLKLYPALNHLFIAGTGKPNPQEYQMAGHVSEQVVNDIAAWVKKR